MTENWKTRFFTIWSGQALSQLGSRIVSFALIWWLTEETGSAGVLATATLMTLLPPVVLGPFAGTLVDRWDRRKVMLFSDASIAFFTAVLMVSFQLKAAAAWQIYGIMLARAIGDTFHLPSMMASTTLMVPNKNLPKVGGMNQALIGVLGIAGPPIGALLLEILPMHTIMAIDVITAAAAIGPLIFFSIPKPKRQETPRRSWAILREMIDGLKCVTGSDTLFFVVVSCTFANIFLGPIKAFSPLLIKDIFNGGALQLSIYTSSSSAGMIIGGIIMTAWGGFRRRLFTSALGWIGIGIGLMSILFMPSSMIHVLYGAVFLSGISTPIGCAPLSAWYQSRVPPDKQGRVFALLGSIDQLTMPLGMVFGAALSGQIPLRFWWFIVGFSHAALGVLWLIIPIIKRADEEGRRTETT